MKCHPRVEPAVTFPFQRVKELKLQTVVSELSKTSVRHSVIRFSKQKPKPKKNKNLVFSYQFPILCLIGKWASTILDTSIWAVLTQEFACDRWQQSCLPVSVSPSYLLWRAQMCVFFFIWMAFAQMRKKKKKISRTNVLKTSGSFALPSNVQIGQSLIMRFVHFPIEHKVGNRKKNL